jgi:dynactin complex subunit
MRNLVSVTESVTNCFSKMVMLGSNEVVVGQRVQAKADGHRATVRFVGSVDGASPEDGWVGVEWDSVGRGKHDGEAKGKRYFTCAPGQGSFVRPENVLAEPVSFQNALTRKYASEEAANAEINMSFREAEGKKAAVVVEFVGNDKEVERMKRTQDLEEVTLLGACISSAGDEKWISEKVTTSALPSSPLFAIPKQQRRADVLM